MWRKELHAKKSMKKKMIGFKPSAPVMAVQYATIIALSGDENYRTQL